MLDALRHAYARHRMRYPIYFFHHLPKCGGTSVREALDQWFHVNDDYYDEQSDADLAPILLSELNQHNCISGHFGHEGYFLEQRYPQIFDGYRAQQRYRAFMFLREPLKMRCSLYRHQVKTGVSQHTKLADAIMPFNNFYARIINVNETNWRARIDQYFFVGLADELQTSFDVLAELIAKPKLVLPVSNSSAREHSNSHHALSDQQVRDFTQANHLDYQIYEYAKSKFAQLKR